MYISRHAFYGCLALKDIYCMNTVPCELSNDANSSFDRKNYSDATLHVPIGSLADYQEADGWKNFKNIVEFDVTAIKDIHVGDKQNGVKIKSIYSLDGKKVSSTKSNQLYILEYSDGRKVKTIVKK